MEKRVPQVSPDATLPLPPLLERWARERKKTPALIQMHAGGARVFSYHDLPQESARIARLLASRGVREGDRVVLWGPNSADWVLAYFAIVWLGAVPVPVDSHAPQDVAVRIAQDAGALLAVQSAIHPHPITPKTLTLETLRGESRTREPLPAASRRLSDPLVFAYTSGTTGDPKGVVLSARAVLENARAAVAAFRLTKPVHLVSVLPLSHMFEFTAGLLVPLWVGGSVTYPRAPVAGAIFDALGKGGATHMVVVPRLLETFRKAIFRAASAQGKEKQLRRLLAWAPFLPPRMRRLLFYPITKRFGASFEYFVCGGAPLSSELADFWERLGFPVYEGYGLTEHSPIISTNTPFAHRPGSVGRPLPGVDVRFGDDGELLVRSPMVMEGYYRREEQTRTTLRDGWLATGDIAEMDADGFLFIRDRKKDMILTEGGFNVYPAEIEEYLRKEEVLQDVCVVGCPSPRGKGEIVAAAVVSDADDSAVARAIHAVNQQVPKPARVRAWVRWEGPFPQTPTLKTKRAKVAQEVCPALASRLTQARAPQETLHHESPVIRELAEIARDITGNRAFENREAWERPLREVAPEWGAWEWWQLLRRVEYAWYLTLPYSALDHHASLASLARVIEARPLPEPLSLSVRRAPSANAIALAGNMLVDERDPLARRWLARSAMPCVAIAQDRSAPLAARFVPPVPHPEVIARLSALLRAKLDRTLIWWVPAEGEDRENTIVLAALVAFHSRRPLWVSHFAEDGATVARHDSLSLSTDLGVMPQWLRELVGRA